MEDAATAEISRSQIWQWIHNEVSTEKGQRIDASLVKTLADEEVAKLSADIDFSRAKDMFLSTAVAVDYLDFLTLPAYESMS